MSYVLKESPALKELKAAIDDLFLVFSNPRFLNDLAARQVSLRNFDHVLSEMSNMLGGAFEGRTSSSLTARFGAANLAGKQFPCSGRLFPPHSYVSIPIRLLVIK